LLPNALASQLVPGQEVLFTQTGGAGTAAASTYISHIGTPGASTTTIWGSGRLSSGGSSVVTVKTADSPGTTIQAITNLTLSGAAGSDATIDFGTSDTVVVTFRSAPIQSNNGSKLTITNWSGVAVTGGGAERLVFAGTPTDFSTVFSQSEVVFSGFTPGYKLVSGAGSYEVVPKLPDPGTVMTIR
jgi:hypothetical protein